MKMGQNKDVVKSKPNLVGRKVINIYEKNGKLRVEYKEKGGS